jgi:hypothetical protein
MRTVTRFSLVAAALLFAHLEPTAAQTARFRHLVSIYMDDQGAGLRLPEGVACGPSGEVIVGDTGNDRLVRFTYQDKIVTGGSVIETPELSSPFRVHLNSKGDVLVLDSTRRRLVRLGPDGSFREALGFQGAPPPRTVVPKDFVIDAADNIYVLDAFSARVLVLDGAGAFTRAVTFPADIGFGSSLAVDDLGGLLLMDSIGRRLFSAGKDATTFVPVGEALTGALATLPTFMTMSMGMTYVVEGSGGSIVTLRRDGTFVARQLTAGWDEGSLNQPSQMCINDRDEAFIADRDNSRVQVFQLIR